MIIGISGFAGSGKDSVTDALLKLNVALVRVALADPLKRIVRDIYDFSDEQLWGPSFKRNEPDKRYPRDHTLPYNEMSGLGLSDEERRKVMICVCCGWDAGTLSRDGSKPPQCYLSPRYALQRIGTEYGRHCYNNTWVDYTLRIAQEVLAGGYVYTAKKGLESEYGHPLCPQYPFKAVLVSDVRFVNEIQGIREAGGKLIRVKRPGLEVPAWQHASETEQAGIPDQEFDMVVDNDGTLEDLSTSAQLLMQKLALA